MTWKIGEQPPPPPPPPYLPEGAASWAGAEPGRRRDPRRFAFLIEINPWGSEGDVFRAMAFRGAITSAWGMIDTLLTEFALRLARIDPYASIRDTYPFGLEKRLKFMRRAFELEGPLKRHSAIGLAFLARFEAAEDLRNTMAHARMQVIQGTATFIEVRPRRGAGMQWRRAPHTIVQLEQMARRATRLARAADRFRATLEGEAWFLPLNAGPED